MGAKLKDRLAEIRKRKALVMNYELVRKDNEVQHLKRLLKEARKVRDDVRDELVKSINEQYERGETFELRDGGAKEIMTFGWCDHSHLNVTTKNGVSLGLPLIVDGWSMEKVLTEEVDAFNGLHRTA